MQLLLELSSKQKQIMLYPYALNDDDACINIKNATHGTKYKCIECGTPMIPKRGKIKAWHFAHKTSHECDNEGALHKTAKYHIMEAFNNARANKKKYVVPVPCSSRCGNIHEYDFTKYGVSITSEKSIVEGTISDLAVLKADGTPDPIVEVVVTHDLEAETKKAYSKSKIPIAIAEPYWDESGMLQIDYTRSLNTNQGCVKCLMRLVKIKENETSLQNLLNNIPKNTASVKEITEDKYGARLRFETRRLVNERSRALRDFGFGQKIVRNRKTGKRTQPTWFEMEIGDWQICADLDSTSVMRMWEVGCEPAITAKPRYNFKEENCKPNCGACVRDAFIKKINEAGIPTRTYFMDHSYHVCGN